MPYDYEVVAQGEYASLTREQLLKPRRLSTKGANAWVTSQLVHKAFDRLSGVDPLHRSRGDLISEKVFDTLKAWLDAPVLESFRKYRNKFVGHAADAYSRSLAPLSRLGLTLDEIAKAQRIVIRIANVIGSQLLYCHGVGNPVPVPRFGIFEHLALPVIPVEHMEDIGKWWNDHMDARKTWVHEDVDLLITMRPAIPADIPLLPDVERSAARAFLALPGYVESGRTVPEDVLAGMAEAGRLWVAVDGEDRPVGFVGCRDLGQLLYVHEISVALPFQKQGIGRRLMRTVLAEALNRGYPAVGLTTRRDAVWNAPFYASLGFAEIQDSNAWPELFARLQKEIAEGADPAQRCAMVWTAR